MTPADLIGTWALDRVVDDRRAGTVSHAAGVLHVERLTDDAVAWTESGTFGRHEFRRRHRIERGDGGWTVLFEDGRPFHAWAADRDVSHRCGVDTYLGSYDLAGLPASWSTRWRCTSPHKDYVITTVFQPG